MSLLVSMLGPLGPALDVLQGVRQLWWRWEVIVRTGLLSWPVCHGHHIVQQRTLSQLHYHPLDRIGVELLAELLLQLGWVAVVPQ